MLISFGGLDYWFMSSLCWISCGVLVLVDYLAGRLVIMDYVGLSCGDLLDSLSGSWLVVHSFHFFLIILDRLR